MDTFHAPARRSSLEEINGSRQQFQESEYAEKILNALPVMAAVLNQNRQVIYANNTLLQAVGISNLELILGKRPGELINCIHCTENEGGCGTSESCRYCGAVNAILECLETGRETTKECRIISETGSDWTAFDFNATASPFELNGKKYIIFSLSDISSQKRRRMLERIFFHDIINTAGGLMGLISVIEQTPDLYAVKDYSHTALLLSEDLIDEIQAQKQLLSAETGELAVKTENLDATEIINKIKSNLEHHIVAEGRIISAEAPSDNFIFSSDPVILKRILINLVKNALEASKEGDTIKLTFEKRNNEIIFSVFNPGFIPREVQLQIFKRSFSTKDSTRGLGTYSARLLTEKYLKGRIGFSSNTEKGTIFSIYLPLEPDKT